VRLVAAILCWRLRIGAKILRERDARLAVGVGFLLVFGAVMVGEYLFFSRSFRAVADLGVAAPPLTLYALEAFFALILVIGILSAVVTGSTVFFRVAENRLFLASPMPLRTLFVLRSVETFVLTSWAFVLLAAPALLALGGHHDRAAGFYLVGAGLLLAFLVLAGALGMLLTMAFGALLERRRTPHQRPLSGIRRGDGVARVPAGPGAPHRRSPGPDRGARRRGGRRVGRGGRRAALAGPPAPGELRGALR
jgi:hypothetical protein